MQTPWGSLIKDSFLFRPPPLSPPQLIIVPTASLAYAGEKPCVRVAAGQPFTDPEGDGHPSIWTQNDIHTEHPCWRSLTALSQQPLINCYCCCLLTWDPYLRNTKLQLTCLDPYWKGLRCPKSEWNPFIVKIRMSSAIVTNSWGYYVTLLFPLKQTQMCQK